MATLDTAKPGDTVKVTKLLGQGAVKRRLMDMGLTKGAEVYVRKVAPLGDPIELTMRGYELSVRKADAELDLPRSEKAVPKQQLSLDQIRTTKT